MKKTGRQGSESKIRVLCVTPELNVGGGIENVMMSYLQRFSEAVEMDFATHNIQDDYFKKIIEKRGGRVYEFAPMNLKNMREVLKELDGFFRKHHDYDIIHCNMANAALFYLQLAEERGIKVRILHSHQTAYADKLSHALRNRPLVAMGKKYATENFACSKAAGEFLFGKDNYILMRNAIETGRFKFDAEKRKRVRKELGVGEDEVLFGCVGRLTPQKNQRFLLDVMELLQNTMESGVRLVLIGRGEMEAELKQEAREKGLRVDFVRGTEKVEEYMCAMDALLSPSVYEGIGLVNIEAQFNGLPVIASKGVPREANVLGGVRFLELEAEMWWKEMRKVQRRDMVEGYPEAIMREVTENAKWAKAVEEYDIKKAAKKIEGVYRRLVEEGRDE